MPFYQMPHYPYLCITVHCGPTESGEFKNPKYDLKGVSGPIFSIYVEKTMWWKIFLDFSRDRIAKNAIFHDFETKNMIFEHFPPNRFQNRHQIRTQHKILGHFIYITFDSTMSKKSIFWTKIAKIKRKNVKIGHFRLFLREKS